MKFMLTRCTGFIGSEVLLQCLRNPAIPSIVGLSRRSLPGSIIEDPKLEVVVMNDFKTYQKDVLEKIEGLNACIWCMGTTAGDRELEIEYPLAFGNAVSKMLVERKTGTKFRYIHLSGVATERDLSKVPWFKDEMRKMKGQAELNMLDFASKPEHKDLWSTLIIKPGFVIQSTIQSPRDAMGLAMGTGKCIRVNELAAAMVDAAVNGEWEGKMDTWDACGEMGRRGREVLVREGEV